MYTTKCTKCEVNIIQNDGCHVDTQYGQCQRTLIFSDISAVYSSFSSATFCSTSSYYSSAMSTIISKHLQASLSTALSFLLPLLFFPLFFYSLVQYLCWMDFRMDYPHVYFYFYLCLFLSSFLFFISDIIMSHLYLQGLSFPFTYSCRLPSSRSLSFSLRISC